MSRLMFMLKTVTVARAIFGMHLLPLMPTTESTRGTWESEHLGTLLSVTIVRCTGLPILQVQLMNSFYVSFYMVHMHQRIGRWEAEGIFGNGPRHIGIFLSHTGQITPTAS